MLKALLDALREDGLLEPSSVAGVCMEKVVASLNAEGLVSEVGWVRTWLEEDLEGAWAWFESHVAGLGVVAGKQVQELAGVIVDGKWLRNPISDANIAVLVRMHGLLTAHLPTPGTSIATDESGVRPNRVREVASSLMNIDQNF